MENFVDLVKDFGCCSKCNWKLMKGFRQMHHRILLPIKRKGQARERAYTEDRVIQKDDLGFEQIRRAVRVD